MKKWNEKLGDYLIDVSKYTITGVVLTAFFNDITDRVAMYIVGGFVSAFALYVGLHISSSEERKKTRTRTKARIRVTINSTRRKKYGKLHWINVYRHTMCDLYSHFFNKEWERMAAT